MKFKISNAYYDDFQELIRKYPFLETDYNATLIEEGHYKGYRMEATIEVKDLDDLMALIGKCDEEIVVSADSITIYDYYLE